MTANRPWSPSSWREKPASQQPNYPDADAAENVLDQLARLPPLVTSWEIESLRSQLARAALGQMFVLQAGDCAESFSDCRPDVITAQLKILLQMSLVLVHGTRKRVVRLGRMAGQYAKPRSTDTETRDGVTLPSYRGDLVNHPEFSIDARTPDPQLLLRGYERAALTLNFIRSLADGGFADLHHPEYWNLAFVEHSAMAREYQEIVEAIKDSIEFMEAVVEAPPSSVERVAFHTSHEGLCLPYEQALTRQVPNRTGWYLLSTHLPWIGMRTADLDGAHVEFFRGLRNPVGVKVGPTMTPEWLENLIEILDPNGEPGRLMLIHRMGFDKIEQHLPPLLEIPRRMGRTVLWTCDPMHGNTETTEQGIKTRRFGNIVGEIQRAFAVHKQVGTILGGVHLELTGEDVTECTGGSRGLVDVDLQRAYRSLVDPRLNYEQAMELAILVAQRMRGSRGSARRPAGSTGRGGRGK